MTADFHDEQPTRCPKEAAVSNSECACSFARVGNIKAAEYALVQARAANEPASRIAYAERVVQFQRKAVAR